MIITSQTRRMNRDIKGFWVEALRSGEYKQTTRQLKRQDCFCVLGVLADLYSKFNGIPWNADDTILNNDCSLPIQVTQWCGFAEMPGRKSLSALNDCAGWSFVQLADFIEENF